MLLVGRQKGHLASKKYGGWRRWALVSPDGVAPSRMVSVFASDNLPLHHKVQKFSSGAGSPRWSQKEGHKTVVVWWILSLNNVIYQELLLVSDCWRKGNNAASVTSLVVDEERMRPGHWWGSVLCVCFSALTLTVRWQEGHLIHKRLSSTNPQRLLFWNRRTTRTQGEPTDPDSPEENGH